MLSISEICKALSMLVILHLLQNVKNKKLTTCLKNLKMPLLIKEINLVEKIFSFQKKYFFIMQTLIFISK